MGVRWSWLLWAIVSLVGCGFVEEVGDDLAQKKYQEAFARQHVRTRVPLTGVEVALTQQCSEVYATPCP